LPELPSTSRNKNRMSNGIRNDFFLWISKTCTGTQIEGMFFMFFTSAIAYTKFVLVFYLLVYGFYPAFIPVDFASRLSVTPDAS